MALLKCRACKGTYRDASPAGQLYFHACAPVRNPRYQPDPEKARFDPRETIARENARDENLIEGPLRRATTGRAYQRDKAIRAAGQGVDVMPEPEAGG